MKNCLLFVLIAFILVNCQQNESPVDFENPSNQIVIGQIDSIYSNILNESRKIWVHIPESATNGAFSETKYPVLYLLDGPEHFYSVTGMIKQLSTSNGNMIVPEMIIIAIPNTNRERDLTPTHVNEIDGDSISVKTSGGGKNFLNFIEKELIPYVEITYPATNYKTFVGHSLGGLTVIDALVERPDLFNNYVAIDPALNWYDQELSKRAAQILSSNKYDGKALYVGVANTMYEGINFNEVEKDTSEATKYIRPILQFVKTTESIKDNGLNFKWKYYNDDDHSSVPLITEYDALRFLFSWYPFHGLGQFFDSSSTATFEEVNDLINSHYENVSDHFGYKVLPTEQFINSIGYELMYPNLLDIASAFFDLNIQNFPKSSNVYDSRGDCYLAQQDSIKALEYFTKALEVGSNDYSQEKIDMLKGNLKE